MKNLFKKGMKVKVCVGKDKGKIGEIIEINRFRNLAKVKYDNKKFHFLSGKPETVLKEKPAGIKGNFLLSAFLTSTMGVSYKLKLGK